MLFPFTTGQTVELASVGLRSPIEALYEDVVLTAGRDHGPGKPIP